jgi:hypothetical protein
MKQRYILIINSLIINKCCKLIKIPEYKYIYIYIYSTTVPSFQVYNDVMCKLDRTTLLHANHEKVKQTLEDKIASHILQAKQF